MTWRAGDWVEVRSKEEILRTLDENGQLEGLPFMPQMFQYCGQRFEIYKRAHKTCDAVGSLGGRKLPHGIHLEHRCNGKAYGGCQAGCLIFWKEAWLKPADLKEGSRNGQHAFTEFPLVGYCTHDDVWRATKLPQQPGEPVRYSCQATQVLDFTQPLKWWDARQYAEDYLSGNTQFSKIIGCLVYVAYYYGTLAYKERWGRPARWLYDRFQTIWGGVPFPRRRGKIPAGQLTPHVSRGLQPGDIVRVKPFREILLTLDSKGNNRNLHFDGELVPYCGKIYRVRTRVERFVDEKTGRMKTLRTPAVILDGVYCRSCYSNRKLFCPRSIYGWWREIWLERVTDVPQTTLNLDEGTMAASSPLETAEGHP